MLNPADSAVKLKDLRPAIRNADQGVKGTESPPHMESRHPIELYGLWCGPEDSVIQHKLRHRSK